MTNDGAKKPVDTIIGQEHAPDVKPTGDPEGQIVRPVAVHQSTAEPDDLEDDGLPPALPDRRRAPRQRTGKSANKKEWLQTCVYLRHETKKAAVRYLEDDGGGEDLSEFLERMLAAWLKKCGVTVPDA